MYHVRSSCRNRLARQFIFFDEPSVLVVLPECPPAFLYFLILPHLYVASSVKYCYFLYPCIFLNAQILHLGFNMSDLTAAVIETKNGFHVDGYEKISYDFTFLDGVFNTENAQLAECYKPWGRVLAVTDLNVYNVYGEQIEEYFKHYDLDLKVHKTKIGEKAKTIPTFLSIVDSMTEFGIFRKVLARPSPRLLCFDVYIYSPRQEPVLVVGGGLVTDVAG